MSNLTNLGVEQTTGTSGRSRASEQTVTTAALTALLARTPARRRAALEVLKVLLRRRDRQS